MRGASYIVISPAPPLDISRFARMMNALVSPHTAAVYSAHGARRLHNYRCKLDSHNCWLFASAPIAFILTELFTTLDVSTTEILHAYCVAGFSPIFCHVYTTPKMLITTAQYYYFTSVRVIAAAAADDQSDTMLIPTAILKRILGRPWPHARSIYMPTPTFTRRAFSANCKIIAISRLLLSGHRLSKYGTKYTTCHMHTWANIFKRHRYPEAIISIISRRQRHADAGHNAGFSR